REEGGAGVCSRTNVSESHGILSLKIPCRFHPVSEFVFGTYDAAFVQAMYEDYLRDPSSVGQEWREVFDNGKLTELPIIPGFGRDRKRGVEGKSVEVGGRRCVKKEGVVVVCGRVSVRVVVARDNA